MEAGGEERRARVAGHVLQATARRQSLAVHLRLRRSARHRLALQLRARLRQVRMRLRCPDAVGRRQGNGPELLVQHGSRYYVTVGWLLTAAGHELAALEGPVWPQPGRQTFLVHYYRPTLLG